MAYPTIGYTYSELLSKICFQYGQGTDPSVLSAGDLAFLQTIMKDGLSRFYGERPWSFLNVPGFMQIFNEISTTNDSGSYLTGSMVIGASVITVTVGNPIPPATIGMLPYTIVGKRATITFNSGLEQVWGIIKEITACTSTSTTFTIENPGNTPASSQPITGFIIDNYNNVGDAIGSNTYDQSWILQDDFDHFASPWLTVSYPQQNGLPFRIPVRDYTEYLLARTSLPTTSPGKPLFVAVSAASPTGNAGLYGSPPLTPGVNYTGSAAAQGVTWQRNRLYVWPDPDQTYTFGYQYVPNPNIITSANAYPYGYPLDGKTILYACLAELDVQTHRGDGVFEARYQDALQASIRRDIREGTKNFGYNADNSDIYGPTTFFGWQYAAPYGPDVNPNTVVDPPA